MATWENEFTTPGSSARIWLVLQVDLVSQSIENNQSTLNWYLRMEERVNASPYNNNPTSTASADVNGTVYSSGGLTYDFNLTNETINIASGTTVVTHDADGSKTISVGGAYNGGNPLGTASFSSTYALPTIPRATQPTVSPTSGDTGATYTIGHTPATSSFYHDIAYSLDGGGSYTDIITNLAGTDVSTDWTPAHTLLPNSTGVTAIIRVITRATSGGTIIGTKTVSLPLTVPASVKPTISAVTFADAQTASPDMPTLMGGAGRFVQRWSKLLPTVTAAGAGGSTITARTVTQNGQTTPSGTAFGLPIALSGSVPYTAVATDSRSRNSDTFASTVAVTAYNFPSLPAPAVQRTSDSGGTTPSPTGTYLKITPAASASSLNFSGEKNLLEYQIRTRPVGGSWTTVQAWTATGVSGVTWTTPKIISGYAANTAYEVEISIRDLFGKNGYDTGNTIKTQTVNVASESVFDDKNGPMRRSFFGYHSDTADGLEVKSAVRVTGEITQGGNAVIDVTDLATATVAGIIKKATTAQAAAGALADTAVTPDGLLAFAQARPPSRNYCRNARFRVNQRGASSGTSLASGAYFLDGWKSTAATNAVTWTGSDAAGRTLTIPASKTIAQVIEGADLVTDDYMLVWGGTAQGRINSGSYGASGVPVASLTAGTNVTIEFNAGTLQWVALVRVDQWTGFLPDITYEEDLRMCRRYYYRISVSTADYLIGLCQTYSSGVSYCIFFLPVQMRVAPTASWNGTVSALRVHAHGQFITNCTAISFPFVGDERVEIQASHSGSAVPNAGAAILQGTGTASGYFEFVAEL